MITKIVTLLVGLVLIVTTITVAHVQKDTQFYVQEPISSDFWPMFQHDAQHTGYTSDDGPETDEIKWYNYACDNPNQGIAVVNGNLYVGSSFNLYCIDAETGQHKWSTSIGSYVYSAPAVVGGNVYIGSSVYNEGGDEEWSGKVYCIDAETGEKKWVYALGERIDGSSPAVVDGRVYIGAFDHTVYCLDATTGSKLWNYTTGDMIYSSPAVVHGLVYIGSNDGKIYCLNAETGEKVWVQTTTSPTDTYSFVKSSPAVVDGRVFIGSANRVYQGNQVLYTYGKVFCLNATNGNILWQYTNFCPPQLYFGPIVSSPAVYNDRVYIGSYRAYNGHMIPITGEVYCFDADPSDGVDEGFDDPSSATYDIIWKYQTEEAVVAPPALSGNGYVYIVDFKGYVYCLNATTGERQWSKQLVDALLCAPTIADGDLYVMDAQGIIYCFGTNNAPEQPNQPSGPTVGLPGITYTFSTVTTDPDGHQVYYYWDWGDGTWTWVQPHTSGEPVTVNHSWNTVATYAVRVYARDILSKNSPWSEPLYIRIINPEITFGNITGGWGGLRNKGKIGVEIKNIGDDAFNIQWNIRVTGGFFGRINVTGNGIIAELKAGETQTIYLSSIVGFGPLAIRITATVDTVKTISKNAQGFIFFVYTTVNT